MHREEIMRRQKQKRFSRKSLSIVALAVVVFTGLIMMIMPSAPTVLVVFVLADNIQGTPGDDTLNGTPQAYTINGFEGNDLIFGEGGDDTLDGGKGVDDEIHSGDGNDEEDPLIDEADYGNKVYGGSGCCLTYPN